MSNPGPPGEDERPLAGPDAGMGLPESGTQHATSTDFALPLDRTAAEPGPLSTGGGASPDSTPPRAQPTPPAYEDSAELVQSPAYDEPPDLLQATPETAAAGTPAYDALAQESGLTAPAEPTTTVPASGITAGGALGKVKAFADERPEAFLGIALAAGWLVGKLLLGSSKDEG